MKQPPTSVVCRLPLAAFDIFTREACRQARPLPLVITAAARALAELPEQKREVFTIGEQLSQETAASLLGRTSPAKPNRRKGGAR